MPGRGGQAGAAFLRVRFAGVLTGGLASAFLRERAVDVVAAFFARGAAGVGSTTGGAAADAATASLRVRFAGGAGPAASTSTGASGAFAFFRVRLAGAGARSGVAGATAGGSTAAAFLRPRAF